jgi:hypothetical protein
MWETLNAVLVTWQLILFPLALAATLSIFQACAVWLRNRLRYEDQEIIPVLLLSFSVMMSFGILGIVLGYLSGLSREPVVGAVLPALLTLVAAVSVYVVGQSIESRTVVLNILVSLSICVIIGVTIGAARRERVSVAQQEARVRGLLDPIFRPTLPFGKPGSMPCVVL